MTFMKIAVFVIFVFTANLARSAYASGVHDSSPTTNLQNSSVRIDEGCTVSFSVNAFIPDRLGQSIDGDEGKWFPIVLPEFFNPRIPLFRGVFGNTDNRGFGGGSSKMEVSVNAAVSEIGSLNSDIVTFKTGRSIVLGKYECFFKTCTQTFSDDIGLEELKTASVNNLSPTESHITFKYAVENAGGFLGISLRDIVALVLGGPLGLALPDSVKKYFNPNIDMDMTVILKKVEQPGLITTTVDFSGATDSFPNYEAFVNGDSIYQFATPASSALIGIRRLFTTSKLGVQISSRRKTLVCRMSNPTIPPATTSPPKIPPTLPPTTTAPTSSLCSSTPTISRGSGVSTIVRNLQLLLNQKGGFNLDDDGNFGPLTEAAVREWQQRNGLEIDGIVGSQTWGSLCSSSGSSGPVSYF